MLGLLDILLYFKSFEHNPILLGEEKYFYFSIWPPTNIGVGIHPFINEIFLSVFSHGLILLVVVTWGPFQRNLLNHENFRLRKISPWGRCFSTHLRLLYFVVPSRSVCSIVVVCGLLCPWRQQWMTLCSN